MQKLFIIIFSLFFCFGCENIKKLDEQSIIAKGLSSSQKIYSEYRSGYKYYLPRGMQVLSSLDFNEVLKAGRYNYYLYVDVVSFYNKIKSSWSPSKDAEFSQVLNNNDKEGYVQITETSNKYLIELMHNYAKIEVIVERADVKETLANATSILASIEYNDTVISTLLGENSNKLKEIDFNIFKSKNVNDSPFLTEEENQGVYEENPKDSDFIN